MEGSGEKREVCGLKGCDGWSVEVWLLWHHNAHVNRETPIEPTSYEKMHIMSTTML